MHTTFKLVLATVTGASLSLLAAPSAVMADDVPSGKARSPARSSSKIAQVRIARCTFPPGAVHVPFPPIFPYLRAERRKDAGAGRKGHTEDRYRYWRVCGRFANSMA